MAIDHDDAELVKRALNGEQDAFEELVDKYWRILGVMAYQKVHRKQDADDVVQETFIRAHKALKSLKDPSRFGAWIYQIGIRQCIDHLRARGRRPSLSLESLQEKNVQFSEEKEADVLETKERSQEILQAIDKLPDHYRIVLTLRYYKDLSYREIADQLGEPQGTISNRIFRALRLLKEGLKATESTERANLQ